MNRANGSAQQRITSIKKRLNQMKYIRKKFIEAFQLYKNEYLQTDVEWLTLCSLANVEIEGSSTANVHPSSVCFEDAAELNSIAISVSNVTVPECNVNNEQEFESSDDD